MRQSKPFSASTGKKIALFRYFFSGLSHVHGARDPESGHQFQVKRPVTEHVIFDHLKGKRHYGVYLLNSSRTTAVVADFDTPERLPIFEFVGAAHHYGLPTCIEMSKSKGFHVWIFLETAGVLAEKARMVVGHILEEIGRPDVEIFPKQHQLNGHVSSGNFILAPLFGKLVSKGKTVFVDPSTLAPYPDQWRFLSGISRVPESVLDDIIEINELGNPAPKLRQEIEKPSPQTNVFGLPLCAQKMLQEGVSQYQRVSCFRLAVHLKRIGLSCDMAQAVLKLWADHNRPTGHKRHLTEKEIMKQTVYAFEKHYRGYGCQSEAIKPFCHDACLVKKRRG